MHRTGIANRLRLMLPLLVVVLGGEGAYLKEAVEVSVLVYCGIAQTPHFSLSTLKMSSLRNIKSNNYFFTVP